VCPTARMFSMTLVSVCMCPTAMKFLRSPVYDDVGGEHTVGTDVGVADCQVRKNCVVPGNEQKKAPVKDALGAILLAWGVGPSCRPPPPHQQWRELRHCGLPARPRWSGGL